MQNAERARRAPLLRVAGGARWAVCADDAREALSIMKTIFEAF
jgi:hypothetical protein